MAEKQYSKANRRELGEHSEAGREEHSALPLVCLGLALILTRNLMLTVSFIIWWQPPAREAAVTEQCLSTDLNKKDLGKKGGSLSAFLGLAPAFKLADANSFWYILFGGEISPRKKQESIDGNWRL